MNEEQTRKIAIRRINDNGGRVNEKDKTIAKPQHPGIKVLGAIDCLINYFKYSIAVD